MLRIRLTRVGKKNSPAYRVVVADKSRAVKRKFIEIVGNYNPILKPKTIVINKDRALFWMARGAQPSPTVNNLMCDLGILPKKNKIKKVFGKKTSKKEVKEGDGKKREEEKPKEKEVVPPVEEKVENKPKTDEKEKPQEEIKPELEDAKGKERVKKENKDK